MGACGKVTGIKMITITNESASGKDVTMVGVVEGRTMYTLDAGKKSDELYNQKSIARDTATSQMIHEAEKLGADAIVCVRYASAPDENGATEITAYGTAVKYK